MVLSTLLSGGNITDVIIQLLLTLPVILFALVVHETAHGYVAWKCGDPTAYNLGRLTLNPVKHLDPVGFFCMMVFGYGWAKPVPVNRFFFKNPRMNGIIVFPFHLYRCIAYQHLQSAHFRFSIYAAISCILALCFTENGHLESQCPHCTQSEAFFSSDR